MSELKQFLAMLPVLATVLAGLAFAHAKMTSTVPPDGDVVASPHTLVLEFDNEVTLTGVELHTIEGVSADEKTLEGEVIELEFDAEKVARSFEIAISDPLPPGEYYLLWRCIAADSHFSTGEFFFTVIPERE